MNEKRLKEYKEELELEKQRSKRLIQRVDRVTNQLTWVDPQDVTYGVDAFTVWKAKD